MGRTILNLYFLLLNKLLAFIPERGQFGSDVNGAGKTRLQQKFRCWSCGLYQTEVEICHDCHRCNSWTLVHMNHEAGVGTGKIQAQRLKPENEET